MKKSLIIVSGEMGQHFLERLSLTDSSINQFHVISCDGSVDEEKFKDDFLLHRFDPTSYSKLQPLLQQDFSQVLMLMDDEKDVVTTIRNIRSIRTQLRVALVDFWNLVIDDPNIVIIDSSEILSNRLLNYLPEVPIVAENIGLGMGEIMEILVPFGSSYVYRHINTIRQKNWRITAIYRNNSMMLARPDSMIQPNDRLLVVGEPPVLKSVFKAIKRQLGQFPAPYGKNLYLFVDMDNSSTVDLRKLVQKALYLHQKFSNKIYIRIINPNDIATINEMKQHDSGDVNVIVDYSLGMVDSEIILQDAELFRIGLIIVDKDVFAQKNYRRTLFESQLPVLKLSDKSMEGLDEAIVPISDNPLVNNALEKLSTAVFDIGSQLDLRLTLFDFIFEDEHEERSIIEHFENLSDIFAKKFHIVQSNHNPIRVLKKRDNFLQCIPFTEDVLPRRWHAFFSTDLQKLFFKLDEYHQIFIPTKV